MKRRLISAFMVFALAFGSAQAVFADENETTLKQGEVKIEKQRLQRFDLERGYNIFDESEFKLASVLNDAVADLKTDTEKELTKEYKMNATSIQFSEDSYQSVYNCGDIVSVVVYNNDYTGGAHGNEYITAFSGVKDCDDLLKFEDLFKDTKTCKAAVKKLICQKIAENPEEYYQYYENAVDKLGFDGRFYFDDEGNLVIFYNPYEIAPYAGGVKIFKFSYKDVSSVVKTTVWEQMKETSEKGTKCDIKVNGKSVQLKNKIQESEDGEVYLPLREVLESIGVEVGWSAKDGVVLNNLRVSEELGYYDIPKYTYVKSDENMFNQFAELNRKIVNGYKLDNKNGLKTITTVNNPNSIYGTNGTTTLTYISADYLKQVLSGGTVAVDYDGAVNIYY